MHVLLVRNERSGSAHEVDAAALLVARGCTVTTTSVADAVRWGEEVPDRALRGVARVIVAGGDGSVGCAANLAMRLGVPLGVVPAGTANDFARVMGLPDNIERACVLAATGDELRDVDLGCAAGTRAFVNVASIGLAPRAAGAAQPLKSRLGALAYPVGALVAAVRSRPTEMVARVDGAVVWTGHAWQAMVASSGAFGGWATTGATRDGDGALDLFIIPGGRRSHRLALDAHALVRGELAERDGVFHARGREFELTTRRAQHVVIDGETERLASRTLGVTAGKQPVRVVVG